MAVFIFFSLCFFVLTVGMIYVGLTIRHHWRLSRLKKTKAWKS